MATIHHKPPNIVLVDAREGIMYCGKTWLCCAICRMEFPKYSGLYLSEYRKYAVTDFTVDGKRLELNVIETTGISTHSYTRPLGR